MEVKQAGNQQTEVTFNSGKTVLFSYETPVAVHIPGRGTYRTAEKHSKTTSGHINRCLERWHITASYEETQEDIEALAEE